MDGYKYGVKNTSPSLSLTNIAAGLRMGERSILCNTLLSFDQRVGITRRDMPPVAQVNSNSGESLTATLKRFGCDVISEWLGYEQFEALCAQLFGTDEVKEHERKVREVFELFDANADGVLDDEELRRCYEWISATVNPVNILLVVNVQNDFIDGVLSLEKCIFSDCGQSGAEVIKPINRLLKSGRWDKVIYSLDWHPEDHISFFENLDLRELHPESKITKKSAKVYDIVVFSEPHMTMKLLPKHCVMNAWGAELHKDLLVEASSERIYKGQDPNKDANSAFKESDDSSSELERILLAMGATHLYVCGLPYDVNVKETCLDGLQLGYGLAIIDDCCRGISSDGINTAKDLIEKSGGLVIDGQDVLAMVNEGKRSLVMAHKTAKRMIQ